MRFPQDRRSFVCRRKTQNELPSMVNQPRRAIDRLLNDRPDAPENLITTGYDWDIINM